MDRIKVSNFIVNARCKSVGAFMYFNLVCCLLFLCSCSSSVGPYNPDPLIAKGVTKNSSFSNTVSIINDQSSTQRHLLDFRGIEVNYNEFTQSLVDALCLELKRHGVILKESAEKKLYLKVTEVEMFLSMTYRADIKAIVRTGVGNEQIFRASRASYGSPFMVSTFPTKPLDSAFKDLVKDILAHPVITTYLSP